MSLTASRVRGWIAREKPLSLLDFLIQWIIRVAGASLWIHEYGHLYGAIFINLYAEIRTTNITAVYPDPTRFPLSSMEHLIFYGSGGVLQCLFFLAMNIRNNDRENRLVNAMVAVHGLVYAVFEAGFPRSTWGLGGLLGSFTGFFIFFLFVWWRKPDIIP